MAEPENDECGTGSIAEIIAALKKKYKVDSVKKLNEKQKLDYLCHVLQLTPAQLDQLMALNSPVFRTVKGHVFEAIFDHLMESCGQECVEVGGDQAVDRIVNKKKLQLKTPTLAGTTKTEVQYKTHKTHGAKSELESLDYYHRKEEFADYLVGLISYSPLRIIFLDKDELPTHAESPDHIISPFTVGWTGHKGVNAFDLIGVKNVNLCSDGLRPDPKNELLPLCSKKLGLRTDIILDTILNEKNFRIWDMSIRGFARELSFIFYLNSYNVSLFNPAKLKARGDKADVALMSVKDKKHYFFQVKGASITKCKFNGENSVITVETMLTRGRFNDHPTQSRLYLLSDFDYLVVSLDPCFSKKYLSAIGKPVEFAWQFYVIPTADLAVYPKFPNRVAPLQYLNYKEMQKYRIPAKWHENWLKNKA